jgi:HemK-like putative methylase
MVRLIYLEHYAPPEANSLKPEQVLQFQVAAETEIHWLAEWAAKLYPKDLEKQKVTLRNALVDRLDRHKPLSYIIGSQPFFQADILCEPPLLIPRTETEEIVVWLSRTHLAGTSQNSQPVEMLDLCCGTGCIGVSLAKQHPNLRVTAADLSPLAVKMAKLNAQHSGIDESRFQALESDMFTNIPAGKSFDLIVSNPPYILPEQYESLPRSVKDWEEKLCLVGDGKHEKDPLEYYRILCETGPSFLKKKSSRWLSKLKLGSTPPVEMPGMVIEVGLQAEHVADLFDNSPLWKDVELHLDLSKLPRWVTACLK